MAQIPQGARELVSRPSSLRIVALPVLEVKQLTFSLWEPSFMYRRKEKQLMRTQRLAIVITVLNTFLLLALGFRASRSTRRPDQTFCGREPSNWWTGWAKFAQP